MIFSTFATHFYVLSRFAEFCEANRQMRLTTGRFAIATAWLRRVRGVDVDGLAAWAFMPQARAPALVLGEGVGKIRAMDGDGAGVGKRSIARMARAASWPFMTGICTSMKIMSKVPGALIELATASRCGGPLAGGVVDVQDGGDDLRVQGVVLRHEDVLVRQGRSRRPRSRRRLAFRRRPRCRPTRRRPAGSRSTMKCCPSPARSRRWCLP